MMAPSESVTGDRARDQPHGGPPEVIPRRTACVHRHEIRPADTLLSIAARYNVPVQELVQLNRLSSTEIWFRKDLAIPCKNPDCMGTCTRTEALSFEGRSETPSEGPRVGPHGGPTALITKAPTPRRPMSSVGGSAPSGLVDSLSGFSQRVGPPSGSLQGDVAAGGPHPKAPEEELQRSANLAMLVEGLVRETDIHSRLARQRLIARHLKYEDALRDCAELRRWQREMDLTTPEIISYLIIYDEDIDRARTALAEDTCWHRETIVRAKVHREATRSSSWINHLLPRLCRRQTPAGYVRLPSSSSAQLGPRMASVPQRGLPPTVPPQIIGRGVPVSGIADFGAPLPQFGSTSVEGVRRRRAAGGPTRTSIEASVDTPAGTPAEEGPSNDVEMQQF